MGETDEYSYNITKDPVSVHGLHASIPHLLLVDHKQLTFNFQSRNYRLIHIHSELIIPLLA
ncbi:MAG: DUF1501 domain-containing protein [Verrucomicrobiaceae bacterium]|nr:MAG: DUF1501 domain-containing protein [Verrucomicrobiaceae bacterium]